MHKILSKPCGAYGTNCYIVKGNDGDVIIDPGDGAFEFIMANSNKVLAILNTHGHYDHIWDNKAVVDKFNCPLYTPKEDIFMLDSRVRVSSKDLAIGVSDKEKLKFNEMEFIFHHFPGHTPGCSMIEFENVYFSGDFLFARSIGRWDFEFSNPLDMIKSLEKAKTINDEFVLLPGHGEKSTVKEEKKHFDFWIRYIKR